MIINYKLVVKYNKINKQNLKEIKHQIRQKKYQLVINKY